MHRGRTDGHGVARRRDGWKVVQYHTGWSISTLTRRDQSVVKDCLLIAVTLYMPITFWYRTCTVHFTSPTPIPTGHPFLDASSHIFGLYIVRQQSSIPAPYRFSSISVVYSHRFLSLVTLPELSKLHSDDDDCFIPLPSFLRGAWKRMTYVC